MEKASFAGEFAEDLQPKLEENVNKFTGASFKIGTPIVEFSERDKVLSKLPEVVVTVSYCLCVWVLLNSAIRT